MMRASDDASISSGVEHAVRWSGSGVQSWESTLIVERGTPTKLKRGVDWVPLVVVGLSQEAGMASDDGRVS